MEDLAGGQLFADAGQEGGQLAQGGRHSQDVLVFAPVHDLAVAHREDGDEGSGGLLAGATHSSDWPARCGDTKPPGEPPTRASPSPAAAAPDQDISRHS